MIRGGSLKKIEKKIIPNVPINKKVYTKASIKRWVICFFLWLEHVYKFFFYKKNTLKNSFAWRKSKLIENKKAKLFYFSNTKKSYSINNWIFF